MLLFILLLFFLKLIIILMNSFYCNIELELVRNEWFDINFFFKKKVLILRFIFWFE